MAVVVLVESVVAVVFVEGQLWFAVEVVLAVALAPVPQAALAEVAVVAELVWVFVGMWVYKQESVVGSQGLGWFVVDERNLWGMVDGGWWMEVAVAAGLFAQEWLD